MPPFWQVRERYARGTFFPDGAIAMLIPYNLSYRLSMPTRSAGGNLGPGRNYMAAESARQFLPSSANFADKAAAFAERDPLSGAFGGRIVGCYFAP